MEILISIFVGTLLLTIILALVAEHSPVEWDITIATIGGASFFVCMLSFVVFIIVALVSDNNPKDEVLKSETTIEVVESPKTPEIVKMEEVDVVDYVKGTFIVETSEGYFKVGAIPVEVETETKIIVKEKD